MKLRLLKSDDNREGSCPWRAWGEVWWVQGHAQKVRGADSGWGWRQDDCTVTVWLSGGDLTSHYLTQTETLVVSNNNCIYLLLPSAMTIICVPSIWDPPTLDSNLCSFIQNFPLVSYLLYLTKCFRDSYLFYLIPFKIK